MAEKKEQIRIEADFDASKLNTKSKKAFNDIQKDADKLSNSANKVSKSFENISKNINNVGQKTKQSTNSIIRNLRDVERQARSTSRELDKMSRGGSTGHGGGMSGEGYSGHGGGSMAGSGMDMMMYGALAGRGGGGGSNLKPGRIVHDVFMEERFKYRKKHGGSYNAAQRWLKYKRIANRINASYTRGKLPDELQAMTRNELNGHIELQHINEKMYWARDREWNNSVLPEYLDYLASKNDDNTYIVPYNQSPEGFNATSPAVKRLERRRQLVESQIKAGTYGQNTLTGRWRSMGFDQKATLLGVGGMMLGQAMPEIARGFGANEQQAQTATSVTQMAVGGATSLAMLGPIGMAGGALIGAATALVSAAKEQERASAALLKAEEENQMVNKMKFDEIKKSEAEEADNEKLAKILDKALKTGKMEEYSKASEEINRRIESAQAEFEKYDKMANSSVAQMDALTVNGKGGLGHLSYDEILKKRNAARTRLRGLRSQMKSYWHAASEQEEAKLAVEEDERKRIAGLTETYDTNMANLNKTMPKEDKFYTVAELNDMLSEAKEYASLAVEAANEISEEKGAEAVKKTTEQLEKIQHDIDIGNSVIEDYEKSADRYKSKAEIAEGLLDSSKSIGEDKISKLSGYKLTDSLTSVGGGRGYGAQMNGVAQGVSKISKQMNDVVKYLKKVSDYFTSKSESEINRAAAIAG